MKYDQDGSHLENIVASDLSGPNAYKPIHVLRLSSHFFGRTKSSSIGSCTARKLEICLRENPLALTGVRFRQVQGINEMHC
jgi:hypothetical protein